MKKNTFFSLSQILFYLFFFVKNGTLYAQGSQELFTNTVIEKSKWKPEFIEKILKIERNVFHKRTYCVEVGNLAKVQKDGFLSFNIPMTGIKATFRATQVEAESEQDFLWIGKSEDKLYEAIFICKKGKLSGTFGTSKGYFQLYSMENNINILLEIDVSKSGECGYFGTSKYQEKPHIPNKGRIDICQEPMRVLVLHTQAGANSVPNINQTIDLSIQQFNTAINNSDIGGQVTNSLVLAGVEAFTFTDGANGQQESNSASNDAIRVSNHTIVQNWRNQYQADIVILLTGEAYGAAFGSVIEVLASNNTCFAVVVANRSSAAGVHTFSHETGHLLGGRHENDTDGPSYSHGHVFNTNGQERRTLMCLRNDAVGDLRILNFSNPNVIFNGEPTGTFSNSHVSRRISETSPTIVNFRSSTSIPFSANMEGIGYVNTTNSYKFESVYRCSNVTSFEWSISVNGYDYSPPVGTSESIYLYFNSSTNGYRYLRCRMFLPNGQIYSIYKSVFVSICSGCRTGEKTTADTNLTDISTPLDVFPNPSTNIVNIQFTVLKTANVIVNVVGDNGISLKGLDFGVLELGNYKKAIEMSEFPAGNYHLNLYVGDEVWYKKIILTK